MRATSAMTSEHGALYERIRTFAFDDGPVVFPFAARLARDNGWSAGFTARVVTEYRRFVFLAAAARHPVSPSDQVDQVWHLHLLYTESYWIKFCRETLGTQVSADNRLSQVLAEYLEEIDTVEGDASHLQILRDRYVADYPDLASELKDHFEHEDAVAGHVWERDVLPEFDRYTEVTRIGHGAMGIVYKAFDRELKRWVALKIPSLDVATTSEARRFRTEAQSMAQLKHRNIVRVLDVKDYEGRLVLSMELVSGGSLDQYLDRLRRDQRSLAKLMVDIARAVHHAHQRGILHRDLKPSNILLHRGEDGGWSWVHSASCRKRKSGAARAVGIPRTERRVSALL